MLKAHDSLGALAVTVRTNGPRAVVAAEGELDIAAVGSVRSAVADLRSAGWPRIVADLRGLSFIDAQGLRLLVELETDARENGWSFAIIDGSPAVRQLLELTNLTAYFAYAELP